MKQRQRLLREEAILDAATQLLREKGFAGMTLDDITDAIGISRPTLYQHFKSKEDLVAHIAARSMRLGCEELRSQDNQKSPVERLNAFIHWCVTVRFLLMGSALSESALSHGNPPPTITCAREELHEELRKLITAAQAAGEVAADVSANVLVEMLMVLMKSPSLDGLILTGQTQIEEIEHAIGRLFGLRRS